MIDIFRAAEAYTMLNQRTPRYRFVSTLLSLFLVLATGHAQQPEQLVQHDSFFQSQRQGMEDWIQVHLPKGILHAVSINTDSTHTGLQFDLTSPGTSCTQARTAWLDLERKKPAVGHSVLRHWAFLAEAQPHEVALRVRCCSKEHFSKEYYLPPAPLPEGFEAKVGGDKPYVMPLAFAGQEVELNQNNAERSEMTATIRNTKPAQVSKEVRQYCQKKYTSLPKARFIWDAELHFIDLSTTEFILEVSYITNVVAKDRFFEYHRIHVQTQAVGADTQLNVDFRAKYGSGILFAPRRNDYKDMEMVYQSDLLQYRQVFFAQLLNLFSK